MKIRSALGALCGAVALTAGLVVSAGTANADSTTGGTTGGTSTTGTTTTGTTTTGTTTTGSTTGTTTGSTTTVTTTPAPTTTVTTTPAPTTTPTPVPCVDPVTGRHCHDWDGDGFHGHYLDLGGVGALDVCGYGTYDQFLGHYGVYRDRFGRVFGANPYSRFGQLRSLCANPAPVVVANDGQCVTYRTDAIRYGNDLNFSRRNFNDMVLRYRLLHQNNDGLLTPSEIDQLRRARALEFGHLNDWDRTWGQLHTVCNAPTPPVTIVNEVPAPASVVVNNNAAPAPVEAPAPPLTGAGHYHYPASAPDTGN